MSAEDYIRDRQWEEEWALAHQKGYQGEEGWQRTGR